MEVSLTRDSFENSANSLIAPARAALVITPSDSSDLENATRAVYVGQGGDLVVKLVGDEQEVMFANVPSGTLLPVRLKSVQATGTTASQVIGLI